VWSGCCSWEGSEGKGRGKGRRLVVLGLKKVPDGRLDLKESFGVTGSDPLQKGKVRRSYIESLDHLWCFSGVDVGIKRGGGRGGLSSPPLLLPSRLVPSAPTTTNSIPSTSEMADSIPTGRCDVYRGLDRWLARLERRIFA